MKKQILKLSLILVISLTSFAASASKYIDIDGCILISGELNGSGKIREGERSYLNLKGVGEVLVEDQGVRLVNGDISVEIATRGDEDADDIKEKIVDKFTDCND